MADRPVIMARDADKARLKALARKPVWTPQERDEMFRIIIKRLGLDNGEREAH